MKTFASLKKWLIILLGTVALILAGQAFYHKPHQLLWLTGVFCTLFILAVVSAVRIREHSGVIVHQDEEPDNAPDIVFIVGPYARTWFSQQNDDDTLRFDNKIIWMLINKPEDLHKQIDAIAKKHTHYQISAIFPVLPDGHDSDALLLTKLAGWRNSFSKGQFDNKIPCSLILYARLSSHRFAHDPDKAIWLGNYDIYDTVPKVFRDEITAQRLKLNEIYQQPHAIAAQHRNAMAISALNWLEDGPLMQELDMLFSDSVLDFTGLLFSDYGNGATRHGAWARWVQKKFAVLPHISQYLTMPPLPVNTGIPPAPVLKHKVEMTPVPRQTLRWSLLLIPLIVTGALSGSLLWSLDFTVQRHQTVRNLIDRFEKTPPNALQQRVELIQKMKVISQSIANQESPYFFVRNLSAPKILISDLDKSITEFSRSPLYVAHDKNIVFDIGSAKLKRESTEYLMPVLDFIKNNPELKILIEGYTDNTGNDKTNINLSLNRAEQVRNWLQEASGFSEDHFITRGLGAQNPIADNDSQDGRIQNRRVEIKIYQESY